MAITDITIESLAARNSRATREAIDAIFWETVSVPVPPAERAAFHRLWLGQYLRIEPHLAFVARDATGYIGGYLVGCHVDPSTSPRFAALTYFQTWRTACARYPAHLHINLTAAWRGRGIGGHLIEAFATTVQLAGLPGLHVVTGAEARNVAFYARSGFREVARTTNQGGRAIVCLGRTVA